MKQLIKAKLTQHTSKFQTWWSGLSLQEKRAVSIGGAVLAILIFYSLFWSPGMSYIAKMRKRINTDAKTLVWMKSTDHKIKMIEQQGNKSSQITTPIALMSVLQKQINQSSLGQSLQELKQAGNDSVELSFKQVQFDKLISFLIVSIKDYRVSIKQFSATASTKPGIVDAEIVMKI